MTDAADHTLYTIRVVMKDQLGNNVFVWRSQEARDAVLEPLLAAHGEVTGADPAIRGFRIADAYGNVGQVDLTMVGMIYASSTADVGRMQNDLQLAELRRQIHLDKTMDRDAQLKNDLTAAQARGARRQMALNMLVQGGAGAPNGLTS